jgi:hypothetical protein
MGSFEAGHSIRANAGRDWTQIVRPDRIHARRAASNARFRSTWSNVARASARGGRITKLLAHIGQFQA